MKLHQKMVEVLKAVQEIETAPTEDDAILQALTALEKLKYPHVMVSFLRDIDGRKWVVGDPQYASGKKWREVAAATKRDFDNPTDVLPKVLLERKSWYIPDSRVDRSNDRELCWALGIVTQYVMPLATKSRLIGTLQVDMGALKSKPLDELRVLDALAAHLSIAIDRFRTLEEIEELNDLLLENGKLQAFDAAAAKIMHELMHSIGDYNDALNSILQRPAIRRNRDALEFLEKTRKRVDGWIQSVSANVASVRKNEAVGDYVAAEIVKEAVEIWYRKAKVRNSKVQAEYLAPQAKVYVRRGALLEILAILIINAIEANARDITVVVDSASGSAGKQTDVLIRVIDDGDGIPKEYRPKLAKFGWTSKGVHGHGLGLTVVKLLCKQMGGSGKFTSLGKAAGAKWTEFVIRLPIADRTKLSDEN